ncbi:MAG: PAS domain-containing protein [Bacillus sp. (in: firmicutes)]
MRKKEMEKNIYTQDILEALDDTSIVLVANPEGMITYVSDSFVEVSKYSREELLGKNYNFLFSKEQNPSVVKELASLLKQKEAWDGEICNQTKEGERWWSHTTIIPFLDDGSCSFQYIFISSNITERKDVEKELKITSKEVQDYKYALDQASIVAITDAKGLITKVNENFCKISKYSKEELVGSDHRILNSGFHSKEFFRSLWKTIGSGEVWKGEIQNKAKDGSLYWVETTIIPFLNEKKKPYQYLAIRNDITEKKKQEELLYRQEKLSALGQLAAGIAHEIRNPLTSMRGYTEFLLLDEEQENRREHLEIILDEINRVNNIVEEFMMMAKPQKELYYKNNLVDIVKNTLALFSYEAKKKKVVLSLNNSDEGIFVLCDENKLKQVFLNLIKNGIEAMPDGGTLTIQVQKNKDNVCVIVKDTGVGISQSELRKLGDPFFTTKETGTGLGLMVSYKIIENHQGKIEIESELGKGATFMIHLPLLES